MTREALTVKRVCRLWLRDHGFHGLCCKQCSCELDDLMPCASDAPGVYADRDMRSARCRPGYRTPVLDRPGYVFIGLVAGRSPRAAPHRPHPDPAGGASRYGPAAGPAIPVSRAVADARKGDSSHGKID